MQLPHLSDFMVLQRKPQLQLNCIFESLVKMQKGICEGNHGQLLATKTEKLSLDTGGDVTMLWQ